MWINPVYAAEVTKAAPPSLNTLDLIFGSSPIVLAVLFLLFAFSVICWAIIITKWKAIGHSDQLSDDFLEVFWSGKSMDQIYNEAKRLPGAPTARIFQAGYKELQRIIEKQRQKTEKASPETPAADLTHWHPPESSIQNLERALNTASRNETMKLEASMTFLATTASSAPFIGLFGTVWGIMGAFQNIGIQGGASLAVVAPHIAEALIATAVGLAAAIPASMGYNFFNSKIRNLRIQMDNFAGDFLNIIKRNFLSH